MARLVRKWCWRVAHWIWGHPLDEPAVDGKKYQWDPQKHGLF